MLVRKACYQPEYVNKGVQCEIQQHVIIKEVIKEVEVIKVVPKEVILEVPTIIEKPVLQEKLVEVEVEKIVI